MTGAPARLGRIEQPGLEGRATVVLLHGFGGEAIQWKPLMRRLAVTGARIVAFDLPGHAASLNYPDAGSAKVAAQAVVAELADLGPVHLVGHSKGGAVAGLVALFAPDKVASLTFLAPGGFGPEINAAVLRRYGAVRNRADMLKVLHHFYAPGYRVGLATMDRMVGMRARGGQPEMLERMSRVITNDDGTQGTLPLGKIAAAGKPMSVVWGSADAIIPAAQAHAMPGAEVTVLDGIGHMLYEEAPEAITDIIARRLNHAT